MNKSFIKVAFFFLIFSDNPLLAENKITPDLQYPALVNRFYAQAHQKLFWFSSSRSSDTMRMFLLQKLDSSAYTGIVRNKNNYDRLFNANEQHHEKGNDTVWLIKQDMRFTDAAIAYCKDLYQGCGINSWIKYDEWSAKYADKDDDYLIDHLAAAKSSGELKDFINSLEPNSGEYIAYLKELKAQYAINNIAKVKQVAIAMNFYKWIHHFNFEKFIVVNIPSATLKFYENDTLMLFSKMIVGKPSRKTPRFDATCSNVTLYPYWNVPENIAKRELLPEYKRSPALIDKENMQVLDAKGNIVNPYSIRWSQYNSSNFPYRFRQSTGCDNSLGIIKFDLSSPFGVYLHDTNEKGFFNSNYRYRSHGCMRVEKAIELGNFLLNNKLDTTFLHACIKGEKPITLQLEKPVPVFVVYLTAYLSDTGVVTYYNDVYHLLHL